MKLNRMQTEKALECCSNKPRPDCDNCPMGGKRGCVIRLLELALLHHRTLVQECEKWRGCMKTECDYTKKITALKIIDAIKLRADMNSYACMISGELHETYTISGKALDEIAKEFDK